ncbi:hypothetical protein VNO80_25563 [Phaseolus coccineus]|uniref:Uncharacterized protein n=1 Tax=Phaseolus coccineus TaxID=3886 RepID=A0AAN9LZK2_PHACN
MERKECESFMNEERKDQKASQGFDLDNHPDQDRAFGCSSAFTHDELAKAVVDVECTNAKWEHYYSSTHERMMKAQLHEGRVSAPAQTIGGRAWARASTGCSRT